MNLDMSHMSAEDVSAMSGRMCMPGVPPKSKGEAKEHLALIRELMERERQRAEAEARETRQRRELRAKTLDHFQRVLLPDFENQKSSKQTMQLWISAGVPEELRSEVWEKCIGNPTGITPKMYHICMRKAHQRMKQSPVGGSGDAASLEALAAARAMRDDDPSFFSPKLSKFESAMQIAVDLPRTIISRSSSLPAAGGGYDSPLQSPRSSSPRSSFSDAPATTVGPSTTSSTRESPPNQVVDGNSSSSSASGSGLSTMLISSMCDDALLEKVNMTLRAFVEYRPDIGYVQGMSYLAAMLLMHMEQEKAFTALATFMTRGHFKYFYSVNHNGIAAHINVFEAVFKAGLPDLYRNFTVIGVHPQMYVIDWWMSLFSRALPYEIATRCWDMFLYDSAYLYRISIGILVYFSRHIHEESSLDEVMMFLSKVQKQSVDADRFFAIVESDALCGNTTIAGIRVEMERFLGELWKSEESEKHSDEVEL